MQRLFTILALSFCISAQADGPFGLEFGLKLDALRAKTPVEQTNARSVYKTSVPPIPHESFSSYLMLITPEHGLCSVTGIGHALPDDADHLRLQDEIDSVERQLTHKYGRPLGAGSDMNESAAREAATKAHAPFDPDRTVQWTDDFKPLRDRISLITLKAKRITSTLSRIEVSYGTKNSLECAFKSAARSNDGL